MCLIIWICVGEGVHRIFGPFYHLIFVLILYLNIFSQAIILHTDKAVDLLKRRKLKKELLFKYLHEKKVPIDRVIKLQTTKLQNKLQN